MAPDAVVTVQSPPPVVLAGGGTAKVRIMIAVAEGYHVQANPASERFLVPVRLEIKARAGIRLGKPAYPPGKPYRLQGAPSDLMTYEGTFEIVVPLEAEESAQLGDYVHNGVLRYQACDTSTCLFPASVPVTFAVRVVAAKPVAG